MLSHIQKRSKKLLRILAVILLLGFSQTVWAAGPPEPSIFSNPLAITLIVLMIILLIIIGILAFILIGAADLKMKKDKKSSATAVAASLLFFLLLSNSSLFAQAGGTTAQTTSAASSIGGLAPSTFYIMASIIFLELLVIITLLINIRVLLKVEREKVAEPVAQTAEEVIAAKRNRLSWWDKFNLLKPVSQEAELDLGHDYDGIRELNNRLPPWWLYGFYVTIVFAAIYLWRFHVSHTGPSSQEEYENAVAKAELQEKEYLKAKGDNIDENTVVFLSDKAELDAGKTLFANGACVSCHGTDGSGIVFGQPGVGPNLTDDYWLNGGSIKNIFTTIKYGVSGKGMQAWESVYSAKQIAQLASFVKSLHGTNPAKAKEKQGELYIEEQSKPAADSLKNMSDSMKAKENKIVMN